MKCSKTYTYTFSEYELRQMVVDYFNRKYTKHLPVTPLNVKLEVERPRYQEMEFEVSAVVEIDEEGEGREEKTND